MDRAGIEAAVIEILAAQLLLPPSEVAPDARVDDLGLDSLGKVEAIFALEERFGIRVPAISSWRREVCGDLTSVFDFQVPRQPEPLRCPEPTGDQRVRWKPQPPVRAGGSG